ncbi:hypothetical protein A0J61_05045 [Choanephora cucurbitarum]|uniref:Uncharacterized protein n=1 Tax=Choanephora cucurbitarum TaxID=101091 RepID=A0A1C7ND07_9FUNG|nr:hypothetical protein A0J61_05045 [Choanephora cucurbitarum]
MSIDNNPYASLDDSVYSEEEEDSLYSYDAEAEWEESKQQLNALFSLVLFPLVGRWFGKKVAFWIWSDYLHRSTPFITLSGPILQTVKTISA